MGKRWGGGPGSFFPSWIFEGNPRPMGAGCDNGDRAGQTARPAGCQEAKPMEHNEHPQAQRLLHAVERILAPPEELKQRAARTLLTERERLPDLPDVLRDRAAHELIRHYSYATAVSGGIASLPALLPGIGTATAVLGGGLADMTLCLKFETEMIMALASLFGHDISDEKERSYCFLLAGLSTYQEMAGKNAALDLARVGGEALWQYTPRQVTKLLGAVFVRLAVLAASKGLIRGIPLAGALVGFAANKMLTARVGRRALSELHHREQLHGPAAPAAGAGETTEAEEVDVSEEATGSAPAQPEQEPETPPRQSDVAPGEDPDAGDIVDAEIVDPPTPEAPAEPTPAPQGSEDSGTGT